MDVQYTAVRYQTAVRERTDVAFKENHEISDKKTLGQRP